jgi:hypothetical protein
MTLEEPREYPLGREPDRAAPPGAYRVVWFDKQGRVCEDRLFSDNGAMAAVQRLAPPAKRARVYDADGAVIATCGEPHRAISAEESQG